MRHLILIDRLSIFYASYLLICGHQVYLMPIEPMRRLSGHLFGWLVRWVVNHPRSFRALDEYPNSQKYWEIPGYSDLTDVFPRTEKAIADCLRFRHATDNLGVYADYYKHVASVYMSKKFTALLFLADICRETNPHKITLTTSDEYLPILYRAYFDADIPCRLNLLRSPRILSNFALFIMMSIYSVGFIFSRLKWKSFEPEKIQLGLDHAEDYRSIRILNEVADKPSDCLIVYRSGHQRKTSDIDITPYPSRLVNSGYVPLNALPQYLRLVARDTLRLFLYAKKLQIDHFFEVIKAPSKKITFRSLFQRFNFSYFLSRDDYNSEHLIRTTELRHAGIVSFGINHGLPNPALTTASWRYIDYDVYFSLGKQLSETCFGDMWPKTMKIQPVGSLGMSERHLRALKEPRPKDIIYFTGPGLGEDLMDEAVIKVAQAFPEKKVYVRNKRRNLRNGNFANTLDNIIHTDENSYDLMLKATYCVGGYSTVIAEAIQFGLATFSFDLLSPQDEYYYRHFPGLCVKSGEEAVERIARIEEGKDVYPTESFAGLIDLSGQLIGDIIRQEMGLTPKKPKW